MVGRGVVRLGVRVWCGGEKTRLGVALCGGGFLFVPYHHFCDLIVLV